MTAKNLSDCFDSALNDANDGLSVVSNLSAGLKAPMEWLFRFNSSSSLTAKKWRAKEEAILLCLKGNDKGNVDLWKLRELALQPGGLLCPELRKRAWPKLTQCHIAVLNPQTTPALVSPATDDVASLKHDVSKTLWNVEDYLKASQEQQRQLDIKLERILETQRLANKAVTFAPDTTYFTSPLVQKHLCHDETKTTPPETMDASPTSDHDEEDKKEEDASLPDNVNEPDIASPATCSIMTDNNFSLCSRIVHWRKATLMEQKILYNVIMSLLRVEAAPCDAFEDDRYRYYSGLQDLTALLMINLESPSLTSLVLHKLASTHLRDVLRSERTVLDPLVHLTFMPLLEWVDAGLFDHFSRLGMMLPTFCRQWIACWFTQDVPDAQVASRLLDVFLVSHALMPMYVAVALLTVHRHDILNAETNLSTMYSMLRSLPMTCLYQQGGGGMKTVEKVIRRALQYMKRLPPKALVALIQNRTSTDSAYRTILPAIVMFMDAPEWSCLSFAPSDHTLLVLAKEMRETNPSTSVEAEWMVECSVNPTKYPLASVALGLPDRYGAHKKVAMILVVVTIVSSLVSRQVSPYGLFPQRPAVNHFYERLPSTVSPPTAWSMRKRKKLTKTDRLPFSRWSTFNDDLFSTPSFYEIGWRPVPVCWATQATFKDIVWKPSTAIAKPTPAKRSFFSWKNAHTASVESSPIVTRYGYSYYHSLMEWQAAKRKNLFSVIGRSLRSLWNWVTFAEFAELSDIAEFMDFII